MEKEAGFRESILLVQIDTEAASFWNPQLGWQLPVHSALITTGAASLWVGWFHDVDLRIFPGGLAHSLLLQALPQLWELATSFNGSLSF